MISGMALRVLSVTALLACCALASCSTSADDPGPEGTPGTPGPGEYLPGLTATVDQVTEPRAVVVVIPGGAWSQVWDPPGFRPLAEAFADAGLAAVQISYGTAETDAFYPRPVDDVACAAAFAAQQVPDVPVVLVGHSAGAHLAVLTGLRPDTGSGAECPYPAHPADAVVGLAGPYDVERLGNMPENLFGVPQREDPDLWREGNPLTWAAERPDVPFLLVHGTADDLPASFAQTLADALDDAGHPVTLEELAGREHNDLYQADVVADLIIGWIDDTVVSP